jgi:hypothetical protein
LVAWRCKHCGQTRTLYSGTVFAGRPLPPPQVVLLLRGAVQGKSTAGIARELELSRTTVHDDPSQTSSERSAFAAFHTASWRANRDRKDVSLARGKKVSATTIQTIRCAAVPIDNAVTAPTRGLGPSSSILRRAQKALGRARGDLRV